MMWENLSRGLLGMLFLIGPDGILNIVDCGLGECRYVR